MRLFAKFFLCAAVVVSCSLLVSGYLLITYSYESAFMRAMESPEDPSPEARSEIIDGLNGQKEQMTRYFTYIYVITLAVSMAAVLVLSIFMTGPVKRMNRAASDIARGRYKERLPVSSGDEIGEFSANFNLMADAVEEKIYKLLENAWQKEDFVANFAHELKTPLTSVIGYADMLYQKTLAPAQVKDAAWYILNEGLRLEALSLKLMDLIILDKQDFVLEEMRSDELFADIAGGLKPLLEGKNVALALDISPEYIMVEYDLFKTLLLNLIDNAVKAGSGRIEIAGKPGGGFYNVGVADDGRGMPETELSRITEAFYTVNKSRSRKQHGAGLGLALAERIAVIHGGPLKFSSREGAGTVVQFELKIPEEIDYE
jgi:signal transduction histidine kinase